MSTDLSSRRALVYDSGLFTGLACNLSRYFGEVLYFTPWQRANPTILDVLIGMGYPEIRRVRDFWQVWKTVDLFVFPDCLNDDLQLHLVEQGKRVWGSRGGVSLELDRWKTKEFIKKAGLPVQPVRQVRGLDNLRAYLRENNDCFVKFSRWRGDMESWEHINYEMSEPRLDELAFRFGPFKNQVAFLVEDKIHTEIEVGYDGICIDGAWPTVAMQGYEAKDNGLLAAVMPYDALPEPVREVNAKLEPFLKEAKYRNFFTTEIRVGEDSLPYLIDATCRQPSPSGEIQSVLYRNLGEILWLGAEGEMVEPEVSAPFAAEAMIYSDWAHKHWQTVEVTPKAQPFVNFFNSANLSETVEAIVPGISDLAVVSNEIGDVVGFGDTIQEAIDDLKKHAEGVKGMGIQIKTDCFTKIVAEIEKAEAEGMKFSDGPLPTAEQLAG